MSGWPTSKAAPRATTSAFRDPRTPDEQTRYEELVLKGQRANDARAEGGLAGKEREECAALRRKGDARTPDEQSRYEELVLKYVGGGAATLVPGRRPPRMALCPGFTSIAPAAPGLASTRSGPLLGG